MTSLSVLRRQIVSCARCARLRAYCARVASEKKAAHRDETYWGRPVPGFGDPRACVLVVGLAPAAHGANRTGRMFTGDSSGDFLMRALHKAGFANQPASRRRGDGLVLDSAYISAAARCAPPGNAPTRLELDRCRPFLAAEMRALTRMAVVVALGRVAFEAVLRVLGDAGAPLHPRPRFGHARVIDLGDRWPVLIASYHPSRQNTNTGRLTEPMFDEVFRLARQRAARPVLLLQGGARVRPALGNVRRRDEAEAAMSIVDDEFVAFVRAWPAFGTTTAMDDLRASEFSRLDAGGHVYLDYTGAGLSGASQIQRHMTLLLSNVLGNPHSDNPTSRLSTELVERARRHVLLFFNASPDEYCVIFTGNASHGLKLIGESYPFGPSGTFLLTFDNHNSVNGIREFARARGAAVAYIPVVPPDLRVDASAVNEALDAGGRGEPRLFAYPAQSNFSGVQHDLGWIASAQARGWDVLLDAAAFVPTNRLDLGRWHPDYVVLSFYKMFGYPTGVGALIARWPALAKLRRPWFAGGTITVASVGADRHRLAPGAPAFEDGTPNFGSLPAVDIGLEFIEQIGQDLIHRRVHALTGWLIAALLTLRHSSGRPLVTLYGPADMRARGGTITLNFQDRSGVFIDHQTIEAKASARRISVRSGCFCNPGAGELAMGISPAEMSACFTRLSDRMTYDDFRRCIDGKSTGAVRVSIGLATNFADVHTFVEFAREFLA